MLTTLSEFMSPRKLGLDAKLCLMMLAPAIPEAKAIRIVRASRGFFDDFSFVPTFTFY